METHEFNITTNLVKTYQQQRKDRMGDAIGDYLTDEEVSARQTYEEILSEIQSWIDYHQKHLTKAKALYALMQGDTTPDDHT